ncbi:transposase [Micromonospora sp. AP08]|uniref:transposase n=1 Tax=Micromonospora sp. AP08 TaxID=2604467 RepID=UPI00351A02F3
MLEPLLPRPCGSGGPPKWSRRQLIDGIRWRTRVGSPWRDVPALYGPWQTVYGLFRRWQRADARICRIPRADCGGSVGGRVSYVSRRRSTASVIRQLMCDAAPPGDVRQTKRYRAAGAADERPVIPM